MRLSMGSHTPPRANAPTGRADRVLVKTGAAERFLVSASLTLLRLSEAGRLTGNPEFAAGLGKWRILSQCSRTQFDPVQGE
jgi:hypothetical protein